MAESDLNSWVLKVPGESFTPTCGGGAGGFEGWALLRMLTRAFPRGLGFLTAWRPRALELTGQLFGSSPGSQMASITHY